MNAKRASAILAVLLSPSLASAASLQISARANPAKIASGGTSLIAIRVTADGKPAGGQTVKVGFVEGFECGSVTPASVTTSEAGTATAQFNGNLYVENCAARILLTADAPPAAAGAQPTPATAETTVSVNAGDAAVKVDGVSAVALIVLASFAIDRLIRGLFFLLSYSKAWARVFPDPELNDAPRSAKAERDRKLIYVALAGVLAFVVLCWFGRIRILAALGFAGASPLLDILLTGLILMGGAERAGQLLSGLGGEAAHAREPQPTPIEISGRLVLDERGGKTFNADKGEQVAPTEGGE